MLVVCSAAGTFTFTVSAVNTLGQTSGVSNPITLAVCQSPNLMFAGECQYLQGGCPEHYAESQGVCLGTFRDRMAHHGVVAAQPGADGVALQFSIVLSSNVDIATTTTANMVCVSVPVSLVLASNRNAIGLYCIER